jgi:hypothetical protein
MSQQLQILGHLKKHGQIDFFTSLNKFRCVRLAARIHELRFKGHKIETVMTNGMENVKYATYIYRGEIADQAKGD